MNALKKICIAAIVVVVTGFALACGFGWYIVSLLPH